MEHGVGPPLTANFQPQAVSYLAQPGASLLLPSPQQQFQSSLMPLQQQQQLPLQQQQLPQQQFQSNLMPLQQQLPSPQQFQSNLMPLQQQSQLPQQQFQSSLMPLQQQQTFQQGVGFSSGPSAGLNPMIFQPSLQPINQSGFSQPQLRYSQDSMSSFFSPQLLQPAQVAQMTVPLPPQATTAPAQTTPPPQATTAPAQTLSSTSSTFPISRDEVRRIAESMLGPSGNTPTPPPAQGAHLLDASQFAEHDAHLSDQVERLHAQLAASNQALTERSIEDLARYGFKPENVNEVIRSFGIHDPANVPNILRVACTAAAVTSSTTRSSPASRMEPAPSPAPGASHPTGNYGNYRTAPYGQHQRGSRSAYPSNNFDLA